MSSLKPIWSNDKKTSWAIIGVMAGAIILSCFFSSPLYAQNQDTQNENLTSEDPLFYNLDSAVETELERTRREKFLFYPWGLPDLTEEDLRQNIGLLRKHIEFLNSPDERGRASLGIIRGLLLRDKIEEAMIEAYRLEEMVWLARALLVIADYLIKEDRGGEAISHLQSITLILENDVDQTHPLFNETLETAAVLLLNLNRITEALDVMTLIPDVRLRVHALRRASVVAAQLESSAMARFDEGEDIFEPARNRAFLAINASLGYARSLPFDNQNVGAITLDLIAGLINLGYLDEALQELNLLQDKVIRGAEEGREDNIVAMAGDFIRADDAKTAMEMVRLLTTPGKRARALAGVARARYDVGDVDAATPLFIMAREEAERVLDNLDRTYTISVLVRELALAGRLADAFELAGLVTDENDQAIILSQMALLLLRQNQYEEARLLTDYIPQMQYRAPILTYLARIKGLQDKRVEASEEIIKALSTGNVNPEPEMIPPLLKLISQTHADYGSPELDNEIFTLARDMVNDLPNNLLKADALVQLAIAEARTEQLKEARQSANAAYRIAFDFDSDLQFPKAMEVIAYGQAVSGDLLAAFDVAARTTLPPSEEEIAEMRRIAPTRLQGEMPEIEPIDPDFPLRTPRYAALARVAATAARVNEMDIAIRAAKLTDIESAEASALAAIAVALNSPYISIDRVLDDVAEALDMNLIPSLVPPLPDIEITLENAGNTPSQLRLNQPLDPN